MKKTRSSKARSMAGFVGDGSFLKPFSALALACFLSSPAFAEDAFTLTPVVAAGDNTITKYAWDEEKNELVPTYYQIDYKTIYGEGDSVASYTLPDGKNNVDYYYNSDTLLDYDVDVNDDGDIVGNFVTSPEERFTFYNISPIRNLNVDFVGTKGLDNTGLIESIVSNFIANNGTTYGGVLYNHDLGTIKLIKADFIGNTSRAIDNTADISTITGNFINNTVTSSLGTYGAAIYNGRNKSYEVIDGKIESISGNFINNSAISTTSYDKYLTIEAEGGAICNASGNIGNISGNFIKNNVTATNNGCITNRTYANGGAIYNKGSIKTITGSFIENSTVSNGYASLLSGGGGNI